MREIGQTKGVKMWVTLCPRTRPAAWLGWPG